MKFLLIGIISLIVLGSGGFFFLGQSSQSGVAAGLIDGRLSPCPSSPNCVSSEINIDPEKKTSPLLVSTWQQLPAALADMGGRVTRQDDSYLSAEFTSAIFKFVDDVEFRLTGDAVHVRSASRVGYSDGGANIARVAELRESLGI